MECGWWWWGWGGWWCWSGGGGGGCRSRPASEPLAAGVAVGLCCAAVLICRCCLRFCRRCFCLLVVVVSFVPVVRCPCSGRLCRWSCFFVCVFGPGLLFCPSSVVAAVRLARPPRHRRGWLKTRERTLRAKECRKAGLACRGVVGGRLLLPPLSTLFPTHHCGSTSRLEKACTA